MLRLALLAAAVVAMTAAVGTTDDQTPKLPPLDSKEWKKVGTDGLEMWDVKEGTGTAVAKGATVKVNYIGWLTTMRIWPSQSTVMKRNVGSTTSFTTVRFRR